VTEGAASRVDIRLKEVTSMHEIRFVEETNAPRTKMQIM